jgi:hypothetical protein
LNRKKPFHASTFPAENLLLLIQIMRWTTVVYQALATAAFSQAFIIPSDTTEGVYKVVTADGSEVHTRIANIVNHSNASLDNSDALDRRDNGQYWCGCGLNMNAGNCDAAVSDLKYQLDSYGAIPAGQSYYSIRGDVVAFACNRDTNNPSQPWDGSYFGVVAAGITSQCGNYIAGSYQAFNTIFGYMRYSNGINFCADSTNSPSNRC